MRGIYLLFTIFLINLATFGQITNPAKTVDITTEGTTYSIPLGSYNEDIVFTGASTGDFAINTSGTAKKGMRLSILWDAQVPSNNTLTILGDVITLGERATKNRMYAWYDGSSWDLWKYKIMSSSAVPVDLVAGDTIGQFTYWNEPNAAWDTIDRDFMLYSNADTSFYIKEIESDTIRVMVDGGDDSLVVTDDDIRIYKNGEQLSALSQYALQFMDTDIGYGSKGFYSGEIFYTLSDNQSKVSLYTLSNTEYSLFTLSRSKGNWNSSTPAQNGDILGDIRFTGELSNTSGSDYQPTTTKPSVVLRSTATEDFDPFEQGGSFEILTRDNVTASSLEQRFLIDGDGNITLTPTDSTVMNGVAKVWDNADRSRWLDLSDSDIIFNGGDRPISISSSGLHKRLTNSSSYNPELIRGWSGGSQTKWPVCDFRGERQAANINSDDFNFIQIAVSPSGGGVNAVGVIGTLTENQVFPQSTMFFGTRRLDEEVHEAMRINSSQEVSFGKTSSTRYKFPNAKGTEGQSFILNSSGELEWGQGSTDSINLTTGSYANTDINTSGGVNAIACNTSGGAITIESLSGGIVNQIIYVYPISIGGAQTITISDASGFAGQQIITGTGADAVITGDGGATMIFDGTYWRLVGIVQ